MADFGVDAVGEIDGVGACRQIDDVAPGSEYEDFVGEDVEPDGLHEFPRVAEVLLPFEQLPQPGQLLLVILVGAFAAFLVAPVGGDAVFGDAVHFPGPDLDFQRLAGGADDGGVQRLVEVGLGHGDEVLEPVRQRLPQGMDDAEGAVAVLDVVDDNPDRRQVVDFAEVFVVFLHLFEDAVEILGPPLDFGLDAHRFQALAQQDDGLADHFLALGPLLLDLVDELVIVVRFQKTEGQVLEFPFDAENTQPVSQGGEYLQGLPRRFPLLFGGHELKGPHVVQAVGEFYQHHADVLGHGQEHLAVIFQLLFFLGFVFDAAQFGDAVDQHGHFLAELLFQFLGGYRRVLHHVVKEGGADGNGVQLEVGEDLGDTQGMRDILCPGNPLLPLVSSLSEAIRLFDRCCRFFRQICLDLADQIPDTDRRFAAQKYTSSPTSRLL